MPEEFHDRDELILLPAQEGQKIPVESEAMMKLQEKSGFAEQVLADEKEDVWNGL